MPSRKSHADEEARGFRDLVARASAPAAPAAGAVRLYALTSDKKLHQIDSTGVDTALGSAGAASGVTAKAWDSGTNQYVASSDLVIFIDPTGTHDPTTSTGGRTAANDIWETGGGSSAVLTEELADARNVSGGTQSFAAGGPGANVDVYACAITVPVSTRPVVIEYGVGVVQVGAGTGNYFLQIFETTSGSPVAIATATGQMPGADGLFTSKDAIFRLGPTTATRVFKIGVSGYGTAGGNVQNASTVPSYITAYVR